MASAQVLNTLDSSNDDLAAIESRVDEIALAMHQEGAALAELRTELSRLESNATQLESAGVDHVHTGELQSGKQKARDSKKDMLQRLETLMARIEALSLDLKAKEA